jgi:hypothetical protein
MAIDLDHQGPDKKDLTERHRMILNHMLGGDKRYRNYYAAEEGSDAHKDLLVLMRIGFVFQRPSARDSGGLLYFHATDEGIAYLDKTMPKSKP